MSRSPTVLERDDRMFRDPHSGQVRSSIGYRLSPRLDHVLGERFLQLIPYLSQLLNVKPFHFQDRQ
jgi:hypothetical protein